jgi:rRNA maturation endonuclease Nob1
MHIMDFNTEKKWCAQCNTYVRYLMSVDHSYCAQCGGRVRLFSEDDSRRFNTAMEKKKFKAS